MKFSVSFLGKVTTQLLFSFLLLAIALLCSCEKFLSEKPDRKLATPHTDSDLQAILDNVEIMNYGMPTGLVEVASDNVYIQDMDWASIQDFMRMEYTWSRTPVYQPYWRSPYRAILATNTVIDYIDQVDHPSVASRYHIEGSAYFYRGYAFLELAQVFALPFHITGVNGESPGIVLKLSSDINDISRRSSLSETYRQIISDFELAAAKLPNHKQLYPTRPCKGAAYGALARCYLQIGDYDKAGLYADSCLVLRQELLNYNDVDDSVPYPFDMFNPEVIFYSQIIGYGSLAQHIARVDTGLYDLYEANDLRKTRFFTVENNGLVSFSGDYGNNVNPTKFGGITTAEVLLIKAECALRQGEKEVALKSLNSLLKNRYDHHTFAPLDINDEVLLLKRILDERRKELVFRGIRWSDIRRLSFEPEFAVTLKRTINGEELFLTPEQLRSFAFLIPEEVIDMSGIPQN